jgi:hypothetical protein
MKEQMTVNSSVVRSKDIGNFVGNRKVVTAKSMNNKDGRAIG